MTHIVGWWVTVTGRTPQFVSTNSLAVRDMVTEGLYVAVAQAVDRAGNMEWRGALLLWTIDLTPPSTTLRILAQSPTNLTTVSVVLGGHDAMSSIDHWVVVIMPPSHLSIDTVVDGTFKVSAWAVDAAGNQDPVGASVTWHRDTVPPNSSVEHVGAQVTWHRHRNICCRLDGVA